VRKEAKLRLWRTPVDGNTSRMGVWKTQSSASNKSKLKSDATTLRLELHISPSSIVSLSLSLSQILMIIAHMINLGKVMRLLVSDLTRWTIFGTWPN
jgi:hypothetical protein